MAFKTERITFKNKDGHELAARLELPAGKPQKYALFSHCFTCSKDIAAATRISRALTDYGIGVLRFDFTGLGNSEGDFSNTNFSSNVADLECAAQFLKEQHESPELLIGHSLGGAAVLAVACRLPEAKAVVTIGAPSDVSHVEKMVADKTNEIEKNGEAQVELVGREFTFKKQFLDDIRSFTLDHQIEHLDKALLIMHSPQDNIVSIDHARELYIKAKHPKSFLSLDGADHMLSDKKDSQYAAHLIASWSGRYLGLEGNEAKSVHPEQKKLEQGELLVVSRDKKFIQDLYTSHHYLLADEPQGVGGQDLGPSPYDFLLAALGSCTSMTVQMYAEHKGWPLEQVEVRLRHQKLHAKDCADCETEKGKVDEIQKYLQFKGDLTEEQIARLKEIAEKCPVNKTLQSEIKIRS